MTRVRVVVADAAPIFRAAVRNLLGREGDFDVLEARNLAELERTVAAEPPDLVLIDAELPPSGGLAAVAQLADRCPDRLIVWGLEPTRESVVAAIVTGAAGYLPKDISPAGLLRSLRGALNGEAPISRTFAAAMIATVHGLEERDRARERAVVLSQREREILAFLAAGARNKQIAEALSISEFTVKRHVQNILQKLGLSSRRAAGAFHRSAFGPGGTALLSRSVG
jgi:two-component system nitrate/nitrite response regulator NarL